MLGGGTLFFGRFTVNTGMDTVQIVIRLGNALIRGICMGTGFDTAGQMLYGRAVSGSVALHTGTNTIQVVGVFGILAFIQRGCVFAGLDALVLVVSGFFGADTVLGNTGFDTSGSMEFGTAGGSAGTGTDTGRIMFPRTLAAAVIMTVFGTRGDVFVQFLFRASAFCIRVTYGSSRR